MKTIELSAALNNAAVKETLKNFVGVDETGNMGLMTPERLAAVAGELNRTIGNSFYTCSILGKEGDWNTPIKIAEEILAVLPMKRIYFICTHSNKGIRSVRGYIYENHSYGIFIIEDFDGSIARVSLQGGVFSVIN